VFKSANKKIAVFLAILAFSYIIASIRLPAYPYVPVDSDAVPISLGFILLILSILLFFVKDNHQRDKKLPKKEIAVILIALGFVLVYIMLFEIVGFVIATALFILTTSRFLGYRNWLSNVIVSISVPLVIYLLFTQFLKIQLPQGLLPF